ncbi:MAG: hypothetical protein PHW40_03795 [Candidatus Izemoplasmatales bacterium]|nr:hypothetical protein [Candidatus Izemoplasmatales bacterium]
MKISMRLLWILGVMMLCGCQAGSTVFPTSGTNTDLPTTQSPTSTPYNTEQISIHEYFLMTDKVGIGFFLMLNDQIALEDVIACGVVVVHDEVAVSDAITWENKDEIIEVSEVDGFMVLIQFDAFASTEYATPFSYRSYVVIAQDGDHIRHLSDTFISLSLYDLTDDFDGDISRKIKAIVEEKWIERMDLSVDFENYEIHSDQTYILPSLTTDYIKITIVVTLETSYLIADDFVLYINDGLVPETRYVIDESQLTITLDDPNWTGYY